MRKKKPPAPVMDDKLLITLRDRERAYLEAVFVGEMIREGGMGFTLHPPKGAISAGAPYRPPKIKKEP